LDYQQRDDRCRIADRRAAQYARTDWDRTPDYVQSYVTITGGRGREVEDSGRSRELGNWQLSGVLTS